jgi:GR25 family glycosyltransferase involved in LPS biosynthesis
MPLVLLINLDKDKERLESSIKESAKAGFTFSRINAISSTDLTVKSPFDFSKSVESCWASHMKALEYLLKSDSEFAIILEDDFFISNPDKFIRTIRELQNIKFDLAQLGFLTIGTKNRISKNLENIEAVFLKLFLMLGKSRIPFFRNNLNRKRIRIISSTPRNFVPNSFQPGSHSYAVSRGLAEIILRDYANFILPTDGFFNALANASGITSYRATRSLVSQKIFSGSMRTTKIEE